MLPRSLGLIGIAPRQGGSSAEGTLADVARLGYTHVQWDATAPGLRARELDSSARRGAVAMLRRLGLTLSGVDAFVPPEHLAQPATQDRAVAALCGVMELAAALRPAMGGGAWVVATLLPASLDAGVVASLLEHAARHGVTLADHAWPVRGDDPRPASGSPLGVGIDAALVALAGGDAARVAIECSPAPIAARWCDAAGGVRVEPGGGLGGRLDGAAYEAALATRGVRTLVVDVRGVADPRGMARRCAGS